MNQERTVEVTLTIRESQWDDVGKILLGESLPATKGAAHIRKEADWYNYTLAGEGFSPDSIAIRCVSWQGRGPATSYKEMSTELGTLYITWMGGSFAYRYPDVPYAIYAALIGTSGSVGRLVGLLVKGKYACSNALTDTRLAADVSG